MLSLCLSQVACPHCCLKEQGILDGLHTWTGEQNTLHNIAAKLRHDNAHTLAVHRSQEGWCRVAANSYVTT